MEEEKKEEVVAPEGEEQEPSKEDFEKEKEVVPANKFNQTLRKQRELEAEKKELEKKLAEKEQPVEKPEEEDVFEEEKKPDPEELINERLKPVLEQISKREANDKKKDRTAFFSNHPEYLNDSERWQTLLDEVDNSLNPNSKDSYYEQLEKAHRIIAGDPGNAEVEQKKNEMARDAASSGDGASKGSLKEEFTPEERRYQKEWNISDEGMKAYKEKLKSGSLRILT